MKDKVDIVFDGHFKLAEGPWWDDLTGELYWIDIPAGDLYRFVWGRASVAELHVEGDVALLTAWQAAAAV